MILSALETFLEDLVFPVVIAAGLTIATESYVTGYLRGGKTARVIESDLTNEELDPALDKQTKWLLFSIYFDLAFLTMNLSLVKSASPLSNLVLAAALVAFLFSLALALTFALRFSLSRFSILGCGFCLFGTVVLATTLATGFAKGTAVGTSVGLDAGHIGPNLIVPDFLMFVSWGIGVYFLVREYLSRPLHIPLRIPNPRPYRVFTLAIVVGWIGVLLSIVRLL